MDTEKVSIVSHHTRSVGIWLTSLSSIILLGTVGYAVYLCSALLIYVGIIWLVTLAIVPTFAVITGIIWLIKYIMHSEMIEIGSTGTIVKNLFSTKLYHPLGIQEYRIKDRVVKQSFEVPTLLSILKEGLLGNSDLLIGYHVEGDQRWGTWDDLRSFVVAGKSRSGKTVTMAFYILQALLSGAKVFVCDPHYNKASGLLKILEPVEKYIIAAKTDDQIIEVTNAFREEMLQRKAGKECSTPMLIVYDEWSELLRELSEDQVDLVTKTVLNCNEAYAGFNGYAMVGGHEWTARESGGKKGASVRRGFHAVICHRLDDEYAKFLLKNNAGKKSALKAPSLPKGHAYFQDSEGELDYICIPYYGKDKEAVYHVSELMQQIVGPVQHDMIEDYKHDTTSTTPLMLPLSKQDRIKIGVDLVTKEPVTISQDQFNILVRMRQTGVVTGFRQLIKILPNLTETHARNLNKLILEEVGIVDSEAYQAEIVGNLEGISSLPTSLPDSSIRTAYKVILPSGTPCLKAGACS